MLEEEKDKLVRGHTVKGRHLFDIQCRNSEQHTKQRQRYMGRDEALENKPLWKQEMRKKPVSELLCLRRHLSCLVLLADNLAFA